MAGKQLTTPLRDKMNSSDLWDLSKLYPDSDAWMKDFSLLEEMISGSRTYFGTLRVSARNLLDGLNFLTQTEMLVEKLSLYAFLNFSGDTGSRENQKRQSLIEQAEARAHAALSFFETELQMLSSETLAAYCAELSELEDYRVLFDKLFRMKAHTLSANEEKLLALYQESAGTAGKAFSMLVTADMDFGTVETPEGAKQLTRQNFSWFLIQPDRDLRRRAYNHYYESFRTHEHTLAALYGGSVQKDLYLARIRNYSSVRAMVLYENNIPESVYDNLISSVHEGLPLFHKFFRLRKKMLGVGSLHPYDLDLPLIQSVPTNYSYEQAVDIVIAALEPFGRAYTDTLGRGLRQGWVDRYENRGKRAGAFTAACYSGDPSILLNYKPNVLRNLFTLAHESGHAMHSWYSIRNNPFQHYEYSVPEAETAANVHERLLYDYLLKHTDDVQIRSFLLERLLNDITAKLFRQTMLAEYEDIVHREVEAGNPVTISMLRKLYRDLFSLYYGSEVVQETAGDLEGLTIPHLYQAYYVYTYAVGSSAALTLSQGILSGNKSTIRNYMDFLKSGGSDYPVNTLKRAGADITLPDSVQRALHEFSLLFEEFEASLVR